MDTFPLYIVDTFTRTGKTFSGNPAAVCILNYDDDIKDNVKQQMAKEINQSATAFISRGLSVSGGVKSSSKWTIRWFSPSLELSLCGHGTLAASKIIFTKITPGIPSITFETKNGDSFDVSFESEIDIITISFPSCPPQNLSQLEIPWINELIPNIIDSSDSKISIEDILYSSIGRKILLRLKGIENCDSESIIRSVTPNLKGMMETVPTALNIIGVGLTIENNQKGDGCPLFYSRFFAPWFGIDEDEVCGSLHSILAPYWSKELGKGNEVMMTRFASPRSGDIYVKLDNNIVEISGKTVIIMEGKFLV